MRPTTYCRSSRRPTLQIKHTSRTRRRKANRGKARWPHASQNAMHPHCMCINAQINTHTHTHVHVCVFNCYCMYLVSAPCNTHTHTYSWPSRRLRPWRGRARAVFRFSGVRRVRSGRLRSAQAQRAAGCFLFCVSLLLCAKARAPQTRLLLQSDNTSGDVYGERMTCECEMGRSKWVGPNG